MAIFNAQQDPEPITIENFLGINEAVGETQIKLGEAVSMQNFRITKNYKAQKRNGYSTFIDYANTEPTYMWNGYLDGVKLLISSNNGKIYEYDFVLETNTEIGILTDTSNVNFFEFNGVLYLQNGTEYKSYDGTTYGDIEPYIPLIIIEASPNLSVSTSFEELNILTGTKKMEFVEDGSTLIFELPEDTIDSIDTVYEAGVLLVGGGTDYTADTVNGELSLTTAGASETILEVTWTKASTANADDINKCRFALDYGVGNDTNIFMWGNEDKPSTRFQSGLEDPTYFPSNNFTKIGSSQFAITDIKKQYSRQIIFKEKATYYSRPEQIQFADGVFEWEYPIFDLNEKVGNAAFNQVRLLSNTPVSLYGQSIWEWSSTEVEDERNANIISDKIKLSLLDEDLSQAITFDYARLNEYWITVGDKVYVYNYFTELYYVFTNIPALQYLDIDNSIYFSTNGTIETFDEILTSDNGEVINARLELGFTDFGSADMQKNSRRMWIVIRPEDNTGLELLWQTDRKALTPDKSIKVIFDLATFEAMNFEDFSFETNRNPQTFRKKIRAKKYAFIKFILTNIDLDETLTILSIRVQAETAGQVR